MKAASGELSLTVITIIAIGAVLAIFTFIMPTIKETIKGQFTDQTTKGNDLIKDAGDKGVTGGTAGGTEANPGFIILK